MRTAFAAAKVNLFLHVTGRRADGYHLLDSLAVFPAVGDRLFAESANELSLTISGPFGAVLQAQEDNLVLQAARVLAPGRGAALILEKHLPVASGIGGGSADAAATLRLLSGLWGEDASLEALAAGLGADVPVCVRSAAARMRGIGEILTPAPKLPVFGIMLINPGVAVSTPAIFKAREGAFSPSAVLPDSWPHASAMVRDLALCWNDLQAPAISLQPAIGEALAALNALPGVLLARMSGSGATCFALFESPAAAAAAVPAMQRPGWWCWGGGLYEGPHADI